MEALSRHFQKAESQKQIVGLKISRYAPPLSHLFYADDAFICCKATPASFETIRDIFQDFEKASGQMINLQKSFIKFSPNSPEDFKSHMTSILRMQASDSFGTYLGVLVDIPKCKKTTFHDILDKITSRISSWSSLHLSQAKPHLHVPRDSGGLGIKSVTVLSQAYLMKNFWRLHHKPTGILAKYIAPKYRKDLPIPNLKSNVTQPSFVWQGICRVAATCSEAMAWKAGNGKSINLILSHWVQGHPPSLKQPEDTHMPSFSDFVREDGSWNPRSIFRFFNNSTAKDILAMEPPILQDDDYLYWKYTEDGCYNIQSDTHIFYPSIRQ
ncbi:uncharacterized protein LOC141617083 [Silene latifolia]|uniref:uncharacterized protein LOC141617083 n=1 Tax=Silene latifolia TaxID=37657 RepID=UPI003D7858EC